MVETDAEANRIYEIPLSKIKPDPSQPRKYFDPGKLSELAESIKSEGLLQPITVVRDGNSGYLLVQGERRYRAHELLGLQTIRCMITEKPKNLNNVRVIENTAREDLSDLELAKEFQKRVDLGQTHEQIAQSIHKKRAYVTQRLALLRLPEDRQEQLQKGEISFTDARILVGSDNKTNEGRDKQQNVTPVTMESLEVYRLFKNFFPEGMEKVEMGTFQNRPILDKLYEAYRKDLAMLRSALG